MLPTVRIENDNMKWILTELPDGLDLILYTKEVVMG
jgi:hypothetical protein